LPPGDSISVIGPQMFMQKMPVDAFAFGGIVKIFDDLKFGAGRHRS
jgi:hypothetical protein